MNSICMYNYTSGAVANKKPASVHLRSPINCEVRAMLNVVQHSMCKELKYLFFSLFACATGTASFSFEYEVGQRDLGIILLKAVLVH